MISSLQICYNLEYLIKKLNHLIMYKMNEKKTQWHTSINYRHQDMIQEGNKNV